MSEITFLYGTAPDAAVAETIAQALVDNALAACVNILPGATTFYRWRGAVERADEVVLIIKTTSAQAAAARDLFCSLHPYETPVAAAIAIDEALSARGFCEWVRQETKN